MDPMHAALLTRIAPIVYEARSRSATRFGVEGRWRKRADARIAGAPTLIDAPASTSPSEGDNAHDH